MSHMKTRDYSSSRLIVIEQQFNSSVIEQNYRIRKSLPKSLTKSHPYALLRKSYCNPIPRMRRTNLPQVHDEQLWFSHVLDRVT